MRQLTIDKAPSDAFAAWAQAFAMLVAAEQAGDDPAQTMRLVNDVLSARCVLTHARIAAGWFPTDDVVLRVRLDRYLLRLAATYPSSSD